MQDESGNVNRDSSPAAWNATEVLLSLFLVWLFWPSLMTLLLESLKALGVVGWYYGEGANEIDRRLGLWVATLSLPFQVLTFPLIFSAFHPIRMADFGLTTRRFGRNVLAGMGGVLVLAPVVFGTYWLVRRLYGQAGEHNIQQHGLEIIARESLFPSEWVLLFFTAILAAPLIEEWTFRGVLQPWLATRRWGGHLAMVLAFVLTLLYRGPQMLDSVLGGLSPLVEAAMPTLFVLGLIPFYLLVSWKSRTPVYPAVFGTSLLFACIHTRVWPTPVPLFVLGLGLGLLAQRTRNLIGPIVLHGLFNSISCVQLLVETYRTAT
jgi:membrane protease YdiL (CAAX protease family)